ncbi:MAG: ferric anguibactin-binding protein, partial [Acinetobacter baumannii]|nr:ferric anguibactin-binding protein [Acinetobacter baumannii]
MNWKKKYGGVALIIAAAVTLQACDQKVADTTQASQKLAEPITVKHALGTTVI